MPFGYVAAAVGGSLVAGAMAGDAPDNSDAIAANAESSERVGMRQLDLAERQYADQKAWTDKYAPLIEEQIKLSTDAQKKQIAQSDSQWASYEKFFRPAEEALATKSLNYDTPERRAQEAAQAAAGVESAAGREREATLREMAGRGIDATSGNAVAALGLGSAYTAAQKAAAGSAAAKAVEDKGMAYIDNTARFGRNMPSTGIQTAAQAQGSGTNAVGMVGQGSAAIAAPVQASSGLFSGANGSFGTAGGLNTNAGSMAQSAWQRNTDVMMDGAAAGLKLMSSKKVKDEVGDVDEDAALAIQERMPPMKAWRYKGDDSVHVGDYAEDMKAQTGLGDGKTIDVASSLGLAHASVRALARRQAATQKSLADVGRKVDRLVKKGGL